MAADQGQEKTDPASPWKRREARKRGDVPRSQDVTSIAGFVAVLVLIHAGAQLYMGRLGRLVTHEWERLDASVLSVDDMPHLTVAWGTEFLELMWPVLLTAFIAGIVANLAQVGFLLTGETLRPDFNRINPFQGMKRVFSLYGLQGLLQSLLKVGVVGYITYRALADQLPKVAVLPHLSPGGIALAAESFAFRVLLNAAIALAVLALLDYGFRRWQWEREKRMSKQEVKEEFKRHEGDPTVRQRIRQKQREMAMKRMMAEVPGADVVITNPAHLAVALRYAVDRDAAPVVVAKGLRLLAERIKDLARAHGIPIITNPPLARSIYDGVEVGREIPEDLYRAVAEILAYVYRLKGRVPRRRAG
jgi:flagellar biosynthetic protein FlhB